MQGSGSVDCGPPDPLIFGPLQDYYCNDSVVYVVGDSVTKPLYLIQGVKQGCNMSPMLFNLFLVDVIKEIDTTKMGITIGDRVITIVSYADDIILFTKHIEHMNYLVKLLEEKCKKINMTVNCKKSKVLRIGQTVTVVEKEDAFSLDQVLVCKYLGVIVEKKTSIYFTDFSQKCLKKCKMYKHSIMTKAKDSYDKQMVARELWNKVALSSILYGSEVIPIRPLELKKMNSEAASVGKFVLQLPKSTSNVTASLLSGIKCILCRFLCYYNVN